MSNNSSLGGLSASAATSCSVATNCWVLDTKSDDRGFDTGTKEQTGESSMDVKTNDWESFIVGL